MIRWRYPWLDNFLRSKFTTCLCSFSIWQKTLYEVMRFGYWDWVVLSLMHQDTGSICELKRGKEYSMWQSLYWFFNLISQKYNCWGEILFSRCTWPRHRRTHLQNHAIFKFQTSLLITYSHAICCPHSIFNIATSCNNDKAKQRSVAFLKY